MLSLQHSGSPALAEGKESLPASSQNASKQHLLSRSRSPSPDGHAANLPKNKSTGNLLRSKPRTNERARIRFSFDAGKIDREPLSRSALLSEHEHGQGASGLRRIRQQPIPRSPTNPPSLESSFSLGPGPSRSSSMVIHDSSARPSLSSVASGPSSPSLNYVEDLSRFPTESLHSFSFAQQSEDVLHNRQNILKRSIDFMRDKLSWAGNNASIATAQAKLSGDAEVQSMMELLARTNFFAQETGQLQGLGLAAGSVTGPPKVDGVNIFDESFGRRSESPENMLGEESSGEHSPLEPREDEEEAPSDEPESLARAKVRAENDEREVKMEKPSISVPGNRSALKRTYTDLTTMSLQNKLMEALARPFTADEMDESNPLLSPMMNDNFLAPPSQAGPSVPTLSTIQGHANRWTPAAQAVFTTEAKAPWTITAANDLACLVFGVTKAEVRKLGILEVVQEDRRAWLEEKLRTGQEEAPKSKFSRSQRNSPTPTTSLPVGNSITAKLLSKPNSREMNRRAQTDDGYGSSLNNSRPAKGSLNHPQNKSRGVLLCGDVVPIQKRNGSTGSASLWVKEKRGGLIWVLEEIVENTVDLSLDEKDNIVNATGDIDAIWGEDGVRWLGSPITKLIPCIPQTEVNGRQQIDWDELLKQKYYSARNKSGINIPMTLSRAPNCNDIRLSSFPHIAGIMVLSPSTMKITSSNSVFSSALFGQPHADGLFITDLIPEFGRILEVLTEEDDVRLVDGLVIPEHSFRRARAVLALREKRENATSIFLRPSGLIARHRDGSKIMVDTQMRVVKSETSLDRIDEDVIKEESEDEDEMFIAEPSRQAVSEVVYALWITYSRHLHSPNTNTNTPNSMLSQPGSPPYVPSPGQTTRSISPMPMESSEPSPSHSESHLSLLTQQIKEATSQPISDAPLENGKPKASTASVKMNHGPIMKEEPKVKKTINDFVILEDMGQGAYGQVKLARYKKNAPKKVVLKYVTKKRILVDTWTRDRRLGTVPLEIHVLDYLRRDGLKHPNICEMLDFFEDDINYYIEMVPHGIPGMDLFDYIELRTNMEEAECKSIFRQVVAAIHHLHSKALVVHRDIKDENVVLDGDGRIKLIDFGSAAYIKNGPFDVFVGTIDYAAPEVLQGKPYRGKEQDVWALGILLYTIVYKENPFYSIDEIMDHELRIPFVTSPECIHLIQEMLDRDVDRRLTIQEVANHPWLREDL